MISIVTYPWSVHGTETATEFTVTATATATTTATAYGNGYGTLEIRHYTQKTTGGSQLCAHWMPVSINLLSCADVNNVGWYPRMVLEAYLYDFRHVWTLLIGIWRNSSRFTHFIVRISGYSPTPNSSTTGGRAFLVLILNSKVQKFFIFWVISVSWRHLVTLQQKDKIYFLERTTHSNTQLRTSILRSSFLDSSYLYRTVIRDRYECQRKQ